MSAFLLDVNVLVALMWPAQVAHVAVRQWFGRNAKHGWATCPITEAGAVRVLSNRAFSTDAYTLEGACRLLSANTEDRSHVLWEDDIGFVEAAQLLGAKLVGHKQVTDAYLLGLTIHRKGVFVTLDRSVLALLPEDSPHRACVELLSRETAANEDGRNMNVF